MTTVITLIVGCGYLGRRVGAVLAGRGDAVVGTTRSAVRAAALRDVGIEPAIADVLDPSSLATLPEADRVLYCVGFDRTSGIPFRMVYIDGLRNLLESLAGRVPRLVYVSSTGVYGQNDGGWVTEDEPAAPAHESGRVILAAERLLDPSSAVIVRSSGLYGPGRIPRRASLERGEPIPGDPAKYLNLVHVDDAARGTVAALDRGAGGRIYHLSDDRPVERREYYALAAKLLGGPPPRFQPPAPDSPEAAREESNKRISNRRLRHELGVAPAFPDITTGLPAALAGEATGHEP